MDLAFLTVEQVATRLQVHTDTVRGWLRDGTLRGHKLGRVWRIDPSDLEQMLQHSASCVIEEVPRS
jgi:acetyl-CoA synthetase